MRNPSAWFLGLVCLFALNANAAQEKEWTVLVFLNGHNNLDPYATLNLNQMETVGSTDSTNLVVQWASMESETTKRLLVVKDDDKTKVTSPIVQELPRVDMGDYNQLVEFIKWGVEHYPARHYFIDIWNHGGGWHRNSRDISSDDFSHHSISTPQLGLALREAARVIGHKVDIYGSDACLMAMAEVGVEMADSVKLMVGSEETEPGAGWPYDRWLSRWANRSVVTANEVTASLVEEYVKSFSREDVTLSTMNLENIGALTSALTNFAARATKLNAADGAKVLGAIKHSQHFAFKDYIDVDDFTNEIAQVKLPTLDEATLSALHAAVASVVTNNSASLKFAKVKGVSIWLPQRTSTYDLYSARYDKLKFPGLTGWSEMLKTVLASH